MFLKSLITISNGWIIVTKSEYSFKPQDQAARLGRKIKPYWLKMANLSIL
jgi:hypothetical protein